MAAHGPFKSKKNANAFARRMERKGFNCSVYKRNKGYGVSVTR